MSDDAVISHEAGRYYILRFEIQKGKYSLLAMIQGLFVSQFIMSDTYEAGR